MGADLAVPNALVILRSVSKIYRTNIVETHALRNITLSIQRGEFVSIAGPSGCGKSTLLNVIGLLDIFDSGSYLLDRKDISLLKRKERAEIRNRHVGFIFQDFNLIGDLTILENVALPLRYRGKISHAEQVERANSALSLVGLTHRKGHFPSQLSGGEQQRASIARGIVGEPSILLADEPTGNLDSSNGKKVIELLTQLHHAGTTICMVTHDSSFAAVASRQVRMFDGEIVEDSSNTAQ